MAATDEALTKLANFFKESGVAKSALNSVKANEETFTQKIFRGAKEIAGDVFEGTRVGEAMSDTSLVRGAAKGEKVVWDMSNPEQYKAAQELYKQSVGHSNTINEALDTLVQSGQIDSRAYKNLQAQKLALRGEDGTGGLIGELGEALTSKGKFEYYQDPTIGKKIKNKMGQIKDYYTEGDASNVAIKAGVTGGTYMAGAVGLRYLSGGTFTTNNNGESDIAGIPFI